MEKDKQPRWRAQLARLMGRKKYDVQQLLEGSGAPQTLADPVNGAVKGEGERGSWGRAGSWNRDSGVRLGGNGSSPLPSRSVVAPIPVPTARSRVTDAGGGAGDGRGSGMPATLNEVGPDHSDTEDQDHQPDRDLSFARAMLSELRTGIPSSTSPQLMPNLLRSIAVVEGLIEHRGLQHEMTLLAMLRLLETYRDEGLWKYALPAVKLASRISALVHGALHLQTIVLHRITVNTLIELKMWGDAEAECAKQQAKWKSTLGDDHEETIRAKDNMAVIFLGQKRFTEAIPLLKDVYIKRKALLGPHDPWTIDPAVKLTDAYRGAGQLERCVAVYDELIEVMEATSGADSSEAIVAQLNRMSLLGDLGRLANEGTACRRLLAKCRRVFGDNNPKTIECLFVMVGQYNANPPQMVELEQLLKSLMNATKSCYGANTYHPDTVRAHHLLFAFHVAAGQWSELLGLIPSFFDVLDAFDNLTLPERAQYAADRTDTLRSLETTFMDRYEAGDWNSAARLGQRLVACMESAVGDQEQGTSRVRRLHRDAVRRERDAAQRAAAPVAPEPPRHSPPATAARATDAPTSRTPAPRHRPESLTSPSPTMEARTTSAAPSRTPAPRHRPGSLTSPPPLGTTEWEHWYMTSQPHKPVPRGHRVEFRNGVPHVVRNSLPDYQRDGFDKFLQDLQRCDPLNF